MELSFRCNNGTWSRIPKCEPARCKTLPEPPNNGMVVVSFFNVVLAYPRKEILPLFDSR